ncbi:MAG: DUF523 domain-containing protein [Myxococcota bacterium]|nr:DUF523 domain-containing protein [Myxococcota bacterium]
MSQPPKLRVGISACLLGEDVRYDGGNRFNSAIHQSFNHRVEWVVVCPEVDAGLGIPRETIHLVGSPKTPRVETTESRIDLTEQLVEHCRARVQTLHQAGLAGFILKARSPSCGTRVSVTSDEGSVEAHGEGVFVSALKSQLPGLPIVNEDELTTQADQDRFLQAMLAYIAANANP